MKQLLPGLWEIDEIGDAVHCYLWEWAEGITLIDTGFPKDVHTILDAIVARGYALHNLKRIIITHADLDHTGSVAQLKRATRAKVACHTVEQEYLRYPSRRKPANLLMRLPYWLMTHLPHYTHRPVLPDELLIDGQQTAEGFTIIHTPGHTPGHISLLHHEKRFLITGDALSNRGGRLRDPIGLYTADRDNALRSIWKLAKKYGDDYEVVLFGHGPPILQNGGKQVKGLVSKLFADEI